MLLTVSFAYLPARAAEPDVPARIPGYAVAADCPTREAWQDALRARLPEALRAQVAGRFDVQIELHGARYVGTLGGPNTSTEARLVRGASCQQVADALTLIAALELSRTAPLRAEQAPEGDAAALAHDPVLDAGPALAPVRNPETTRFGVTGFALLQALTAPRASLDLGVGVQLEWQQGALSPWLLLGMYWGQDAIALPSGGASAHFERWSSYLVGCPLRFPRQSAAALRPCVSADLGRIEGEGQGVPLARDSSSLLATTGVELRFEWLVLGRIELGAVLGQVFSWSRPRFYFAPDFTALQVGATGLRTGASASVAF